MTLATIAPTWLLALLALLLLAAAVQDATTMRISNLLSLGVIVLAVTAMALHGFTLPMWQNGMLFLVLLLVGTAIFSTGALGGGDVKLLAALGLWFKFADALWLLVVIAIAGGVVALVMIVGRRLLARASGTRTTRGMIPYGVAIVAGTAFMIGIELRAHRALDDRLHRIPVLAPARAPAPAAPSAPSPAGSQPPAR